jgi:hypothetical protein
MTVLFADRDRELIEMRDRVVALRKDISYKDGYNLKVGLAYQRVYLQVTCWRKDTLTGEMGWGFGGKGYLSPHMTDQEIVQLAFGLFKGYEEHECREFFMYKGKRIYGPHIALDALLEIADRTTYRS